MQDGAIFAFAFGTNPEALLLLEACSEPSRTPARVSGGALAAELDGQEVWLVDEANPPHDGESYMNRRRAALGGVE